MAENEQKALQLMAEAEKKLTTNKGFFGSLFGCVFQFSSLFFFVCVTMKNRLWVMPKKERNLVRFVHVDNDENVITKYQTQFGSLFPIYFQEKIFCSHGLVLLLLCFCKNEHDTVVFIYPWHFHLLIRLYYECISSVHTQTQTH